MAETDYAKGVQWFRCNSRSYFINQETCDGRQARNHRACKRCKLKTGGKDDPRKTVASLGEMRSDWLT